MTVEERRPASSLIEESSFYLRGENLTNGRTSKIFSFGTRGAAYFTGVRLVL
jgi:hypothetical protein